MQKSRHPLKNILHPYIFVLKEGRKIKKDFLDYSLMMLFIHSNEKINSPDNHVPAEITDQSENEFIDFLSSL